MLWSNRRPNSIHKTPFDLQFLKNDMGERSDLYNCKEGWQLSVCEEIWSEDLMVVAAAEGGVWWRREVGRYRDCGIERFRVDVEG
jgi:hypothetical protein